MYLLNESSVVLLCFEWLITFGAEVSLFWQKKLSIAAALFVFNRLAPLAYNLSGFYVPTDGTVSTGCPRRLQILNLLI